MLRAILENKQTNSKTFAIHDLVIFILERSVFLKSTLVQCSSYNGKCNKIIDQRFSMIIDGCCVTVYCLIIWCLSCAMSVFEHYTYLLAYLLLVTKHEVIVPLCVVYLKNEYNILL